MTSALIAISLAGHLASGPTLAELEALYREKQYFDLRDQLKAVSITGLEVDFYRAVADEKFNHPARSNETFAAYLRLGGTRKQEALRAIAWNSVRLGDYKKAASTYARILAEPALKDRADILNVAGLWGALRGVPRQEVKIVADTALELSKNMNLPIESNGQKLSFIFDTGANISTVSETFAQKLGLRLAEARVMVGGIGGAVTAARLGVSKELRIGNVIVKNAVFLVFPDKDLFIKSANFQLNGILGFPVISALREFTITQNGRLIVPQVPRSRGLRNLALEGLNPYILGQFGSHRMTFALDSGANTSMLYPPFYHRVEWYASRLPKMQHRFAGVGSARSVEAFAAKDLKLGIGGREVSFSRIPVIPTEVNEASKTICGNLGQDMLSQFESVTINFELMSVEFGPPISKQAGITPSWHGSLRRPRTSSAG